MTNYVFVDDYSPAPNGDWAPAFEEAFTHSNEVRMLARTYVVKRAIQFPDKSHIALRGCGMGVTTISSTAPDQPVMVLRAAREYIALSDFSVEHSVAAGPGGDGIQLDVAANYSWDNGVVTNVRCSSNYIGWNLGMTGYTTLLNCGATDNVSHGFSFTSHGKYANNPLQYYLTKCISAGNRGDGYHYATVYDPGQVVFDLDHDGVLVTSVGALESCVTYKNRGNGISAVGLQTNPIASIRIDGGFYGEDGGHGIYLDTWGGQHLIRPGFIELEGDCGIYLSDHNSQVQVGPTIVTNNGNDGMLINCPDVTITGGQFIGNGRLHNGGRSNGIYFYTGGSGVVTGVRAKSAGGQQDWGVVTNADVLLVGNDLRNNNLGAQTGATNPNSIGNRV